MLCSVVQQTLQFQVETVLDSASGQGTVLNSAAGMGQCWTQCSKHGTLLDSASKCDMDTMGTITLVM